MPRPRNRRGVRGYQERARIKAEAIKTTREGRPLSKRGPGRPPKLAHDPDAIPPAMPVIPGRRRPGRPKSTPPLEEIKRIVETTGASFDEITALPTIPARCFDDPAMMSRIRDVVERAQLVFRMNLRTALAEKGIGKLSVTALMGLARNTEGLKFDQQTISLDLPPDAAGLELKIDDLLERLAKRALTKRALTVPPVPAIAREPEPAEDQRDEDEAERA